jgi:uncharacterized RDD family membrane protein YckC
MAETDLNPYAAPVETLPDDFAPADGDQPYVLATLGQRFSGNLIDALLFVVPGLLVLMPMRAVNDGPGGGVDQGAVVLMVGLCLACVVLAVTQCMMIASRGQSIGKRLVRTKIIRLDGSNPGFVHGVLVRSLIGRLPGVIPVVGNLYNLADALFVFRRDRRTLHDLIAGTRVIQV